MDITSYLLGKKASGGGGGGSSVSTDWGAIGYTEAPKKVKTNYEYAVNLMENFTPTQNLSFYYERNNDLVYMPLIDTSTTTNMGNMFSRCTYLEKVAKFDTHLVTNMDGMFNYCSNLQEAPLFDMQNVKSMISIFARCSNLKDVPLFNIPNVEYMGDAFSSCVSLTDNSLNNILGMCASAVSYKSTKTLAALGLTSTYYSASKIQGLSNYQAFIDAGWTIGY